MADHIADEEQLEALKRWWKQYGASLALAVVLGVGSWFGWSQWQSSRESRAQAASLVYEEMMSAIGMTAIEELAPEPLQAIAAKAEQLKKEYGDTQYDRLARLLLARLAVAREDFEVAAAELRVVMDDDGDQELALLARLRLVRVLTAQQRYDDALRLAETEVPDAMVAEFAEARGDVHGLRGEREAAASAYQAALDASAEKPNSPLATLLRIKLDQVKPAATKPDATKPEAIKPEVTTPAAAKPEAAKPEATKTGDAS